MKTYDTGDFTHSSSLVSTSFEKVMGMDMDFVVLLFFQSEIIILETLITFKLTFELYVSV